MDTIDTPEFRELLKKYHHSTTWDTKLIAFIEAVRKKDREEASAQAMDALGIVVRGLEADRDHFKAIAERQAAGLPTAVIDWVKAEQARIDAVHFYNAAIVAAKKFGFPGPDTNPQYQEMEKRRIEAHKLIFPMHEALTTLLSPAQQEPAKCRCGNVMEVCVATSCENASDTGLEAASATDDRSHDADA